jgi:ribonuclease J
VRAGRLVLDGDIIAPANGEAMIMRRRLAADGIVVVVVGESGQVRVSGVGLPLDEDYSDFVEEAEGDVAEALAKLKGKARRDLAAVTEAARLAARRAAKRWSGKKPQVQVMLLGELDA